MMNQKHYKSYKNKVRIIPLFVIIIIFFISVNTVFAVDDTSTVTDRVDTLEKDTAVMNSNIETFNKNFEDFKTQQQEDNNKFENDFNSLKDEIKEVKGTEVEDVAVASKQLLRRMNKMVDLINFLTIAFAVILGLFLLISLVQGFRNSRDRKKLYDLITLLATKPVEQQAVATTSQEAPAKIDTTGDPLFEEAKAILESLPNPDIFDKDRLFLSSAQREKNTEFSEKVELFESHSIKLGFLSYYIQAVNFFQEGEYEKAVFALNKGLEKEPNNYLGYLGRGISLLRMEILDEALQDLNRVIKNRADISYAYYARAAIYSYLGKLKPAIRDLKTAIQHDDVFQQKAADDNDFDGIAENEKFIELIKTESEESKEEDVETTVMDEADDSEEEAESSEERADSSEQETEGSDERTDRDL